MFYVKLDEISKMSDDEIDILYDQQRTLFVLDKAPEGSEWKFQFLDGESEPIRAFRKNSRIGWYNYSKENPPFWGGPENVLWPLRNQ